MVGWWVVKRVQRCKWVGRWAKAKRQAVRDKRLMPGIVGSSQRVDGGGGFFFHRSSPATWYRGIAI